MPNLNLTQTDLNASLRGLTDVDIKMYLPNKNVYFGENAVTTNSQNPLSYTSNIKSLIEFTSLPQANIATFENNSWILDGSFMSPSKAYGGGGDSYTGYISNNMTDNKGNYTTNPVIKVTLMNVVDVVDYISIQFAGGIDTSYPKQFVIKTYNESGKLINSNGFEMADQVGLPLLVAKINDKNVKSVEFEFVGTMCPHRRSRLNKIMFGKVEQVNPYYLQSWKIDDKASLVADSIPTKTLTYSIINYEGDYDIDNPGNEYNKLPKNYNEALVLFTFSMEIDGLWKYAPTKTFNLTDVSTNSEGVVTFTCGSILDVLTKTFDEDRYEGIRTIETIMRSIATFSSNEIGFQYVLNEFGKCQIDVPIPESPIREIIQKLAFSSGATLTVDDDNRIIFSKKDITPKTAPKFMFDEPEPFNSAGILLEEPHAEPLEHTKNIAMYTYNSKIAKTHSEVGSVSIPRNGEMRVSFSPISGALSFNFGDLKDPNLNIRVEKPFSQHAIINAIAASSYPVELKITRIKSYYYKKYT